MGTGNPCTQDETNLFYASTTIMVGDGNLTSFWEAPWLGGLKPRDIAPQIFAVSKTKKWCIKKALENNAWVHKITLDENFSHDHLTQFVDIWIQLLDVQLEDNLEDTIAWNLMPSGEYPAASAYKAQFFGAEATSMKSLVWKVWAPPKVKFFAWLALQKRLQTSNRLATRGWPNCGLCPLCKRTPETISHLLFECRFTTRLWRFIKDWLGRYALDPT